MNYEQRTKQWGEGRGEGALDTSNEQLATSDEDHGSKYNNSYL